MATPTQDPAGYYVWEVPGQPVIVHIRLDVVDRLAAEVMRGFGAVPKRGAEVGGVLIGTTRPGVPAIVRIDDFEAVPCEYRRGPSYLFTEEDGRDFEDCWNRLQPASSPSAYVVGYFRSHTRDGFSLEAEDLELLDQFFPGPAMVALLIKPYATRVSVGAFFVREHGDFPEKSPLEFPLRRRELLGGSPAAASARGGPETRAPAAGCRGKSADCVWIFGASTRSASGFRPGSGVAQRVGLAAAHILVPALGGRAGLSAGADDGGSGGCGGGTGFVAVFIGETQ